jgi:hypothetical protein
VFSGNAPHGPLLGNRLKAYTDLIDQDLGAINFALLYIEGVRLANSEAATNSEIEKGDLPPLDAIARERLIPSPPNADSLRGSPTRA